MSRTDIQDLGTVDKAAEFDIESSVQSYDNPQRVISEWFRFEGRKDPGDYGVIFFQGWESYSDLEKIEAVRDAKKVLDRTLKKK